MTLWDTALDGAPEWHDHLAALDAIVVRMRDVDPAVLSVAESLGSTVADRVSDRFTAPAGIYGYGLWSLPGEPPRPAIFVQPGLAPSGSAPAAVTPAGSLLRQLSMTVPDGTVALALPPPQLQRASGASSIAPGTCVTVGSRRATLGLRVQVPAAGAHRAILTAGHAAPGPGALVRDEAGDVLGTVLSCMDLDDVPPGVATADVAVVRIDDRRTEADTDIGRHVDAARQLDEVRLAKADARTIVLGVSPSFALRQDWGSWGHVAITAAAISRSGDSGAPVHRADGAVVGHVVAGYGTAYSLIQDAEYIARESGATLR